jgi:hypothetical protein
MTLWLLVSQILARLANTEQQLSDRIAALERQQAAQTLLLVAILAAVTPAKAVSVSLKLGQPIPQ